MIYIERLNLYFVLNKVAYVLQTKGSAESPQFRIDGKTKDYYKMKLINDSVFNLTLDEGDRVINALNKKYNG